MGGEVEPRSLNKTEPPGGWPGGFLYAWNGAGMKRIIEAINELLARLRGPQLQPVPVPVRQRVR